MLQNPKMKNSKQGFSLPLAMAISLFLIIISTSLIFISMQSTSSTSVDISGRQAYLNVKSALDYATSYYSNNVTDYSTVKTQYMIMKDKDGGTIDEGAEITDSAAAVNSAKTWVVAVYIKSEGAEAAKLKLSAYSRYSDAFGYKGKVAHLSFTYSVGSSAPNRLTIIQGDHSDAGPVSTDSITLNVKKPKGMTEEMVYYVWTYEDVGNAYENYDENEGHSSYTYDAHVKSLGNNNVWNDFVNKMNASTRISVKPNAEWMTTDKLSDPRYSGMDLVEGPNGIMSQDGSGWVTGEYFLRDGRVPWFNIIFATYGSTLAGDHGANNIYNTQTNEIFHLWYLDPGDKNIYFEFFDTVKHDNNDGYGQSHDYYTKYYRGYYRDTAIQPGDWDGKKGLEDTVLVYVTNPKTTIHFRMYDVPADNLSATTSLSSEALYPRIVSVESSKPIDTTENSFIYKKDTKRNGNIAMRYEGCGWWVANVETNDTFALTLSFNGHTAKAYNITSNTINNEFWLVYMKGDDGIEGIVVSDEENRALADVGIDPNSYVTVHTKVYDYNYTYSDYNGILNPNNLTDYPYLIYGNVALNSSTGRSTLLMTVTQARRLVESDYNPQSYAELKTLLTEANAKLTDPDFIKNQPGSTDSEKLNKANEAYLDMSDKIIDFIENKLQQRKHTEEDLKDLKELVDDSETAITTNRRNYDINAVKKFEGSNPVADTPYKRASKAVVNPDGLSLSDIKGTPDNNFEDGLYYKLQVAYGELMKADLGRGSLESLINSAIALNAKSEEYEKGVDDDGNEIDYVVLLDEAIAHADTIRKTDELTKGQVDDAYNALDNIMKKLKKKSVLDTTALRSVMSDAEFYLVDFGAEKVNCTDETYNALEAAYEVADTVLTAEKQEIIDDAAAALQKAVNNFLIIKPADTNDALAYNDTIRVWIWYDETKEPVNYIVDLSSGDVGHTTVNPGMPSEIADWGKNFHYVAHAPVSDVSKSMYNGAYISAINSDGELKQLTEIVKFGTLEDNNIIFQINSADSVTVGKTVTVYGELYNTDGTEVQNVKGQIGSTDIEVESEGVYYVARYVLTEQNKNSNFKFIFDAKNADGVSEQKILNLGKLAAGEYVTQGTTKVINVKDIYPKYDTTTPTPAPEEPSAEPTLANSDDLMIADMAKTCDGYHIYFTDNYDNNFKKWEVNGGPYAYFFNDAGQVGNGLPGYKMDFFEESTTNRNGDNSMQREFMIIPPDGAKYVIFSGNGQQTVNITFAKGTKYWKNVWQGDKVDVGKHKAADPVTTTTVEYTDNYVHFTNNKRASLKTPVQKSRETVK